MEPDESSFLFDATTQAILKHREAHFGGSFELMLDYYRREGKGVSKDFGIEEIEALAEEEKLQGQNLAALLLSGADAEEIADAREAYQSLRSVYNSKTKSPFALLLADLILSELENPEKEIAAIVEKKKSIVPFLIDLVKSEEMRNPLFPGYGQAPNLAAQCLGLIGDKSAIISLFESIGKGDFFDDDLTLHALQLIGEPAKQFLLTVLQGKPINEDNERAAIALVGFKDDPEVAETCFKMLQSLDLKKDLALATYLIVACEWLPENKQAEFEAFAKNASFPKELQNDFKIISSVWKQKK